MAFNNSVETTALCVTNGQTVQIHGVEFTVTAAHYSGPVDGSGTTTLEFGWGHQWQGPASTPVWLLTEEEPVCYCRRCYLHDDPAGCLRVSV